MKNIPYGMDLPTMEKNLTAGLEQSEKEMKILREHQDKNRYKEKSQKGEEEVVKEAAPCFSLWPPLRSTQWRHYSHTLLTNWEQAARGVLQWLRFQQVAEAYDADFRLRASTGEVLYDLLMALVCNGKLALPQVSRSVVVSEMLHMICQTRCVVKCPFCHESILLHVYIAKCSTVGCIITDACGS